MALLVLALLPLALRKLC
uniref:Uncharacterized protein n=1 Tax=Arundo donax TaxID=35708 RepID=A0A0A8ZS50_ARUDO